MTMSDLTYRSDAPSDVERRIDTGRADPDAVLTYLSGAGAALATTWLIYYRLTPFSGLLGFAVCCAAACVLFIWALARMQWGAVAATDHAIRVAIALMALVAVLPLAWIVLTVISRGYHALNLAFWTKDLRYAGPQDAFDAGGVSHSIVGTLEVVGMATLISVPLGVASAVFLNEVGGRLARQVRMVTDAMSAIPSIVAGLFIFAVLIQSHLIAQSGIAGALALALLMLPTVTRTTEVVLRLVPGGLREASLALGGTEWRTTSAVVLPTARTGIVTAVILGIARVIGETAPLILTMLGAQIFNANPFSSDKQDALPLFVWNQIKLSTGTRGVAFQRAWSGAFVLMSLVLILFVTARVLSGRSPGARRSS
jgi:phosphate transport system permease protein